MREFIKKFIPKKLLPLYEKYEDTLLYIFFGALTTLVSFGAQQLGILIFNNVVINTTFSWICAVLFAFFTNRIWVFEAPTKTAGEFFLQLIKFFGSRFFTYLIELLIMFIFVDLLSFKEMIVKVCAQVIILVLNFILSKFMVFKKEKTK